MASSDIFTVAFRARGDVQLDPRCEPLQFCSMIVTHRARNISMRR